MGVKARYTEQLIALVDEGMRERIYALADKHGVSTAAIARQAYEMALPELEQWDGTTTLKHLSR